MRVLSVALAVVSLFAAAGAAGAEAPLRLWGEETLERIQQDLWLPARGTYAEHANAGKPAPDFPAWNWSCGVQLSALAAATQLDRNRYEPRLQAFLKGLRAYWVGWQSIAGFDVMPNPGSIDRYYDDNEWMGLALLEAHDATHDRKVLDWAEDTMRFVLSGEDDTLGGGIYWRELERRTKNTCSNGPAVVLALRLYQHTHRAEYLQAAQRLYAWTNAHLQDKDGLYWDNIGLDGKVGEYKWSYNTALMLRADVLFYEVTHDRRYLAEARRVGSAAESHWIDPQTGAIHDEGPFAHLLAEAWLALAQHDRSHPWARVVTRALEYVHAHVRDPNGHYAKPWGKPLAGPLSRYSLIDQASAARAYWAAARSL